jgi:hypothetical protein
MCIGVETAALIAAAVGAAGGLAGTGAALSKKGPKLPKIEAPLAPPPPPPPPAPLPPAPTETDVDEAATRERRKRTGRYGISSTLLASPLGNPTGGSGVTSGGRTLLGG